MRDKKKGRPKKKESCAPDFIPLDLLDCQENS